MSGPFGATSTTDEVLEGVDLSGKRILVTGVSAGLGVETARVLAAHGRDGAYQKLTHYGDVFMHDDELAWAAAEETQLGDLARALTLHKNVLAIDADNAMSEYSAGAEASSVADLTAADTESGDGTNQIVAAEAAEHKFAP